MENECDEFIYRTTPHHTYRLEKEKGTHRNTYTHTRKETTFQHSTYETREQQPQEGSGMELARKKERKKENDTKSKLLLLLV